MLVVDLMFVPYNVYENIETEEIIGIPFTSNGYSALLRMDTSLISNSDIIIMNVSNTYKIEGKILINDDNEMDYISYGKWYFKIINKNNTEIYMQYLKQKMRS